MNKIIEIIGKFLTYININPIWGILLFLVIFVLGIYLNI